MAAPTYGASGTYLAGELTNTASVAAPAGVAADSVVILPAYIGILEDPIVTPPSGFTLAAATPVYAGTDFRLYVMWHRATGSEAGPYTITWTGGTGQPNRYIEAQAHRFEGCVTTGTPLEAATSSSAATSATSSSAVSTTTLGADRLVLLATATDVINTWTAPSGYTSRMSGGFSLSGLFTIAQAVAGSTGTVQAGQTSGPSAAWLGALIPTGGAVDPPVTRPVMGSSSAVQRATW